MKINNVELKDIDLLDADTMEDIENAISNVMEDMEESKSKEVMSEIIRIQCTAIMDCFNAIFGEGTDKKLFGDKTNLRVCLNAFKELQVIIEKQMNEAEKEFAPAKVSRARK